MAQCYCYIVVANRVLPSEI